ncbi:MAG TPA: metallophosphoesterase family protein [Polyangiaceae bacterium]|nr:metallophosphoesterase family protein [Polyangiaceae bacterium]
MPEYHAEPYLYLAGLTHKAALIAWGGFYFRVRGRAGDEFKLVDDSDLDHVHPPRKDTVGARSQPYGRARVEVFDLAGKLASFAETFTHNHAWLTGLEPDTEYTYRVLVEGEEWAAGERRDWVIDEGGRGGLRASGRSYENRFRTHPHPESPAPLTFAVLGDFGTGVRHRSTAKRRQREVAAALERAVVERGARLVLTTGDNIYAGRTLLGIPVGATGDEDDDWFFTFYQPYRYVLNRVPVYPSVGNHDGSETEASDDRDQLLDNFYLNERFAGEETAGRASIGPGLFYRFAFGADVEFVCIDTSRQSLLFGRRFFEHPNHAAFLEAALPEGGAPRPRWLVPFGHHPPFCAGPIHGNSRSMIEHLVPRFERAGVRAVFSGHEHNFQYSRRGDVHYFVTGAGGKVRTGTPGGFDEAHTVAWAAAGHFLLVQIEGDVMRVFPLGEPGPDGAPTDLPIASPGGEPVPTPIVIKAGP